MRGSARLAATLLFAAALGSSALTAGAKDGGGGYRVGDVIADFALKSDTGKTVKLSSFKHRIVVINFFASW